MTRITYPNQVVTELTYDRADRLVGVASWWQGGEGPVLLYAVEYTLNAVGHRVRAVQRYGAVVEEDPEHDDGDGDGTDLASAGEEGEYEPLTVEEVYGYDPLRRLVEVRRTRGETGDGEGDGEKGLGPVRLASEGDPEEEVVYRYEYDAAGNRTRWTVRKGEGDGTEPGTVPLPLV